MTAKYRSTAYTRRYPQILDTRTALPLMASPDTWNLDDIRDRVKTPQWLPSHRAFFEGDHLQAGPAAAGTLAALAGVGGLAGWIAPMLPPDHPHRQNQVDGIVRGFVSANKVGEVVGRHKAGVAGRQPAQGFESRAPIPQGKEMPPAIVKLKETADAWMAARWEAEGIHGAFQNAMANLLYAGRQPVRMVLPRGFLNDTEDGSKVLPVAPLPDMINMLYLTYPKPEECTVWTDPDTFQKIGIFTYEQEGERWAEVTWVDRSTGLTHIRKVGPNGDLTDLVRYDFGGLLPIYEMVRTPLVTPQIIQNQKALNLALTSIPGNVWSAGTRARALFNVDPPGRDTLDANGNPVRGYDSITWGSGVINYLNGAPVYDKDGNIVNYATPSMHVEEPVDIAPAKAAVDAHAWEILSEARQLHAIMSADATASGISRIVARVEFMGSLMETKPVADGCLEWQYEIRLAMAEAFAARSQGRRLTDGQRLYSANLRANAECKLDPGPITPEEKIALDQLVTSGRLSDETAMMLMGVEDVKEEKARKDRENKMKNVFTVIREADELGIDRYAALTVWGGVSEEEARALARGDVVNGLTQ